MLAPVRERSLRMRSGMIGLRKRDSRTTNPAIMARAALEPQGRWGDLQQDTLALYDEFNEANDGSFRVKADYLVTVAELPAGR